MYVPKHFEENRPEVLSRCVREHPLGLLITQGPGGVEVNAIPFLLDPEPATPGVLRGHVARANPVWRAARTDVETVVVFQGPEVYVSPSLYATKATTGKVAPTWNYVIVEARGYLRVHDDRVWVQGLVGRLTERHESSRATPWKPSDAPAEYIEKLLGGIVGIEIPLTSLRGKWKVSQPAPPEDRASVARGLREQGGDDATAIAELVERRGE